MVILRRMHENYSLVISFSLEIYCFIYILNLIDSKNTNANIIQTLEQSVKSLLLY